MKKMTKDEFEDRTRAILKAKKIFIPHITKNITIAFELYQGILAQEGRRIQINKYLDRASNLDALRGKILPRCPWCGTKLSLRVIMDKGKCPHSGDEISKKSNMFGWKTCWECRMEDCYYEEYSELDLKEWTITLPGRETQEGGN